MSAMRRFHPINIQFYPRNRYDSYANVYQFDMYKTLVTENVTVVNSQYE